MYRCGQPQRDSYFSWFIPKYIIILYKNMHEYDSYSPRRITP